MVLKNIQKMLYGTESNSNLGTKLWDLSPGETKKSLLSTFSKIKLKNGSL